MRLPQKNVYYVRAESGEVITDGFQVILVSGSADIEVDHVELSDDASGFELTGVLYAGGSRQFGSVQLAKGFPPNLPGQGPLLPVGGATVAPGRVGIELLIGMRVNRPGFLVREGIRVYYTSGGHRYFVDYPSSVVVCPNSLTYEECESMFSQEYW